MKCRLASSEVVLLASNEKMGLLQDMRDGWIMRVVVGVYL